MKANSSLVFVTLPPLRTTVDFDEYSRPKRKTIYEVGYHAWNNYHNKFVGLRLFLDVSKIKTYLFRKNTNTHFKLRFYLQIKNPNGINKGNSFFVIIMKKVITLFCIRRYGFYIDSMSNFTKVKMKNICTHN